MIYIDGGARGNPGPAAAGVVIQDESGRVLHESAHFLGTQTSNTAEYQALLLALERAARLAPQPLTIHSDSELLVRQMTGEYRVRNPRLAVLHGEAQRLLLRIQNWSFRHIPREQNQRADYLVNLAIDRGASTVLHDAAGEPHDNPSPGRSAQAPPNAPAPVSPHRNPSSAQAGPGAAAPPAQSPGPPPALSPAPSSAPRGTAPILRVVISQPPRADVCRAPCGEASFRVGETLPAGLCLHAAHALLPTILGVQRVDPTEVALLPTMIVHCAQPRCGAVFQVGPATSGNGQAAPPGPASPQAD